MDAWEAFIAAVPWFLDADQIARAGATEPPGTWRPASPEFSRLFPRLSELLAQAHVTEIAVDEKPLILFSWSIDGDTACWLCDSPTNVPSPKLCSSHRVLARSFGGIRERCAEPASWLLNLDSFVTLESAASDASFLLDYAWAFPDERVPLEVAKFYPVAREANGNTTLCERDSEQIILFAPDHSFEHVRPWRGLPEYTLYTLEGAPDFRSFIEVVAEQWLAALL